MSSIREWAKFFMPNPIGMTFMWMGSPIPAAALTAGTSFVWDNYQMSIETLPSKTLVAILVKVLDY